MGCRMLDSMTCPFHSLPVRCIRLLAIFFLWDQALYGERLLPARLRELLFKPNLESYGFGWGILIPKPGFPNAGDLSSCQAGAIFGFQSVIERIPRQKELIVLLDNTDSPKLLEIALEIRRVLAKNQ